jgi:hypothetical protein
MNPNHFPIGILFFALLDGGLKADQVLAWHNFYPRIETEKMTIVFVAVEKSSRSAVRSLFKKYDRVLSKKLRFVKRDRLQFEAGLLIY